MLALSPRIPQAFTSIPNKVSITHPDAELDYDDDAFQVWPPVSV